MSPETVHLWDDYKRTMLYCAGQMHGHSLGVLRRVEERMMHNTPMTVEDCDKVVRWLALVEKGLVEFRAAFEAYAVGAAKGAGHAG